jgi:hypothetical protein
MERINKSVLAYTLTQWISTHWFDPRCHEGHYSQFVNVHISTPASRLLANTNFKEHLKQLYSEWLLAVDHILILTGKISIALLCQWIKTSWQQICPEATAKRFKKCCVSSAMNVREDDIL